MNQWPSGWQRAALKHAGITPTDFAESIMTAWCKSTPTDPWTNNPIGLPAHENGAPRALDTRYALFHTTTQFRDAFKRLLASPQAAELRLILTEGSGHGQAWREISQLGLPASDTETDYPSAILDMLDTKYRATLTQVEPKDRKGQVRTTRNSIDSMAVGRQQRALYEAARTGMQGAAAMGHIVRRLG